MENWRRRHPRWHLHFIPTHSSWLNQVKRFFAQITDKRIRRGVFRSLDELKAAIDEYITQHNGAPKPFCWTATTESILEKIASLCKKLP